MPRRFRHPASLVHREFCVCQWVLAHRRTPRRATARLAVVLGCLALLFDLIPDWIPVLGQVDDALVVPGLVCLAIRMIPQCVVAEHRRVVEDERRSI